MYKTIIFIVLLIGLLGLGFLFARSCSNNKGISDKIAELESDLTGYENINNDLRARNRELSEQNREFENNLEELRGSITEARAIIEELSENRTRITANIKTLSGQLQRAFDESERIRAGVAKLKSIFSIE